jgi:hypothetical protein
MKPLPWPFLLLLVLGLCRENVSAQLAKETQPTSAPPAPLTTQLKKSVVFIETTCLARVTEQDLKNVSPEEVAKLKPEIRIKIEQQYLSLLLQLSKIDERLSKVSPTRAKRLEPTETAEINPSQQLSLQEELRLVGKLIDYTADDIGKLTAAEFEIVPKVSAMGTGFLVGVHDERLKKEENFVYLVTNRHVVQPGIEDEKPCVVMNYSVMINKKSNAAGSPDTVENAQLGSAITWHYSNDPAVDLAVVPVTLPPSGNESYDALWIPDSLFINEEMVKKKEVVEGDPVLFAGLFIQTFNDVHRLEPIVRSGTLAMIPDGTIRTTLKKPGIIFLTDAHAYHGNSGSPVLVDVARFSNKGGYDYRVLGIVSGGIPESADFTLQAATTYQGTTSANSGISTVVPATQLEEILRSDPLKQDRDAAVSKLGQH